MSRDGSDGDSRSNEGSRVAAIKDSMYGKTIFFVNKLVRKNIFKDPEIKQWSGTDSFGLQFDVIRLFEKKDPSCDTYVVTSPRCKMLELSKGITYRSITVDLNENTAKLGICFIEVAGIEVAGADTSSSDGWCSIM